jgi:hypothetical protein
MPVQDHSDVIGETGGVEVCEEIPLVYAVEKT